MCVQHFHVDHAVHQLLGCVVMVMVEFCGHVCVCACVCVWLQTAISKTAFKC